MDRTDIMLSQLLMLNSRLTYRELADHLGLSVNAVHKRVRAMMEADIIRGFRTRISLSALRAVLVMIFGGSAARPIDEAARRLQEDDSTYWVSIAGANYLYVGAFLSDISRLEQYVFFVKNRAKISEPVVGIWNPPVVAGKLSTLDYRILYSLQGDARKPLLEVADQLGVSVRRVRRHLTRMLREGLVEMGMEWYPDRSNDIFTMVHLQLRAQAEQAKVETMLRQRYGPNLFFSFSFSNLPNLILCWAWTNTMKELKDLLDRLRSEETIESIVPNVLYTGYIFDTWRDRLLMERASTNRREVA